MQGLWLLMQVQESSALANIERAALLIKEAKTLDETFVLKALFREAEIKARRQGLTDVEQKAIEYKFWVQDKIGELLDTMKQSGERVSKGYDVSHKKETLGKTLQELGLTKQESYLARTFHNLPVERKEEIIDKAKKRVELAKKQVQIEIEHDIQRENPEPVQITKDLSITIIHGAFQESALQDSSIDAIITDPPYGKVFDDWLTLGQFSSRVLKPSAWFVSYSGQSKLDEKIRLLSCSLSYYWMIAVKHREVGIVPSYGIQNAWKPILVYAKPPIEPKGFYDLLEGFRADKVQHEWGQPEEEAIKLIEVFSKSGDTILEPFAGGGSTIEACIQTERNCIAFEKDDKTYVRLKKRFPDSK